MIARRVRHVTTGVTAALALALAGCLAPWMMNHVPTANAGPDQTVSTGSTVALNAQCSRAPDGGPPTYAWEQIAGEPTVTLQNADSAVASFTAPEQATSLTFRLTVSDCHGNNATATTVVTVVTAVVPEPILYIANSNGPSVTAYYLTTPAALNGDIPPNANLAGGQTLLANPAGLALDEDGGLLVSNPPTPSVTGYANALNLGDINGNVAPNRDLQGVTTALVKPYALAVSTAEDLLFAAEADGDVIRIYDRVSTLNGDIAPVRTITSADINQPRGMSLAEDGQLYVANLGNNTISVFANAGTLNGHVAASRVITSPAFDGVYDVFVSSDDTMYVVNSSAAVTYKNQVSMFANATGRNGSAQPGLTLIVLDATNLTSVAVDCAGNGYIADAGNNAIYGYDNIATRNGTLAPDRTLKGANTQLASPIYILLHE